MAVYLDNAATGQRKPDTVFQAMEEYFHQNNCNPGRGGYGLSLDGARKIMAARNSLARLFNINKPQQIIFTQNVTTALNFALKGLLGRKDHVLITGLEHNAVLRPLKALEEEREISFSIIPTDPQGAIDLAGAEKLIQSNTTMIVATHASNVMGTLVPIRALSQLAKKYGLDFVVDSAQTAGALPIDIPQIEATVFAFTGHKHLLGPLGTGGFYISEEGAQRMKPLYEGGTGSLSDQEEQPEFLPDRFESGTPNVLGIVGLGAGAEYLMDIGVDRIRAEEEKLIARLLKGLRELSGTRIYGPQDEAKQTGTIAINIKGKDNAQICALLDHQYNIMTRPGLHCAPLAHKTMGTFPEGVLRISMGHFTTQEEIDYCLTALREISSGK